MAWGLGEGRARRHPPRGIMLGRPLPTCVAALLLFTGCSGGSSAQQAPVPALDVSASSAAAEAPAAAPSESAAAVAAELAFADTICAKPEMASLPGKTKSKANPTAGAVSVDGANIGNPVRPAWTRPLRR